MKDSPENKTSKLYFTPMDFSDGDRFDETAQNCRLKSPLPDSIKKFSEGLQMSKVYYWPHRLSQLMLTLTLSPQPWLPRALYGSQ